MIAIFALTGALFVQSEECSSLLDSARNAYAQRQYTLSISQFEQARAACPASEALLLPLAQAQLMAVRLEDALKSINAALAINPRRPDSLKLKGDILYLLGREGEAVRTLQSALVIEPSHEGAEYALARIYYQQNRFPDAQRLFTALVEQNEKNYRAHDNLALCYAAQGQESDALRHFFKALDLVKNDHPEYDTVYGNAANFFLERNEYQKGFQLAAEAAKRNPSSARNMFLTGKALAGLEKFDLSLRWFQRAIDLEPTYSEACYWLARIHRKLGNVAEADRALARFKELSERPKARR